MGLQTTEDVLAEASDAAGFIVEKRGIRETTNGGRALLDATAVIAISLLT